jgi:hypothetical protein
MSEQSYQDAVQVLRDRMGGRWEGLEGEGRDEMARVLKQALGYDDDQADSAIKAMLRTGQLQYHHYGDAATTTDSSEPPPASPVMAGPQATNTNMPGAPVRSGEAFGPGFWEIGREGGDALSGRAGQVQPS